MLLSLALLTGVAFLAPSALTAAKPIFTAANTIDVLSKSGIKFDGTSEFNDDAYKRLAALRKLFATPASTTVDSIKPNKAGSNRRLTNSQRLKLGLPPNPPTRRDPTRVRRQEPSPAPLLSIDIGLLSNGDTSSGGLGYVSADLASSGQLAVTADAANALELSVRYNPLDTLPSNLRVEVTNDGSPIETTVLSLINGRDNVSPNVGTGSWHYLYVGTAEDPGTGIGGFIASGLNSFFQMTGLAAVHQTDIWSLNPVTGQLSAIWYNQNGLPVPVYLYIQSGVLLALADPIAFQLRYPDPITPFIPQIAPALFPRK